MPYAADGALSVWSTADTELNVVVISMFAAASASLGRRSSAEAIRQWCNDQVSKTQRLSAIPAVAELPRSAIGKVLKRELREAWQHPTRQATSSPS